MNLPIEYTSKISKFFGDDFDEYMGSFEKKYFMGIRANLLKINEDELSNILDFELSEKVPWCDTGFYYKGNVRPAKNPYYNAGLFYIQEPSAMSVGAMLPICEGDKVLDLCSAPGGKATHIATKLNNTGVLVCNDISTSRCRGLVKNIELNGVSNAIITNETPKKLSNYFGCYFDKIIIDAPCSGEGMFRKDKETLKNWTKDSPLIYHKMQIEILDNAKDMLSDGGIIAYSTCTFSPEENEMTIYEFLKNNKEFELIDFDKTKGFVRSSLDFLKCVDSIDFAYANSINLEKCGRLLPHKVDGEGHFLALIRKVSSGKNDMEKLKDRNIKEFQKIKNETMKEVKVFFEEYTNISISEFKNLYVHKASLFSIPDELNLDGLRIIRSGFHIGEFKKNRFEPSQALAMSYGEYFKNRISLSISDDRIARYFKGESFSIDDISNVGDGWAVVCIDKYPIGFGKVHKNRLKNKYAVGWIN